MATEQDAKRLDRLSRMTAMDRWLDEMDDIHGAPPTHVVAEADEWFDGRIAAGRNAPSRA